jgi:hypothetical protein
MEFENETGYATAAIRAQLLYRDLIQTIVVVKGTFAVDANGQLAQAEEQQPVLLEDTPTDFGVLETEMVPAKPGCDVAVLGSACAARGAPVEAMRVSLSVGDVRRSLAVFGDRIWEYGLNGLHPCRPRPFVTMPLTYARAFGGVAPDGSGVFFENPEGRGFATRMDDAIGMPLPNVEEPGQLITRWDDRPPPAGMAPLPRTCKWRGERGIVVDVERETGKLTADAFSFASPSLALSGYPAGERVSLTGCTPDGPWRFSLPSLDLALRITLGDFRHQLPFVPDTLYLQPSADAVVVAARCTFIYQVVPHRHRAMRVTVAPGAQRSGVITSVGEERRTRALAVPLALDVSPDMAFFPVEEWLAAHPLAEIIDRLPLCVST